MKRVFISISGAVQGVGFRPFVYRLAQHHNLVGSIRNTSQGVYIDAQGAAANLAKFQEEIISHKPERAEINEFASTEAPLHKVMNFSIATSESQADTALALLPDTAMCPNCLEELFDPRNRRYRYPFAHCVTCGPRFSMFLRMPFDRENTTMTDFCMCAECRSEYANPSDRRFYSQTNCCPKCGPELSLLDRAGQTVATKDHAIAMAVDFIRKGKIIAVKNTGGYQLLVDATNEDAVMRLRTLKQRAGKPFALLVPDLAKAQQIALVDSMAEHVLTGPAAPIVLVKRLAGSHHIAQAVAPDSPYYGIMLPHNALQHLLMKALGIPLIATSGNKSGKPLCITEEEALTQLASVADAFLVHNRRIMHRLDDSIVHIIAGRPMVMRRARGYIPYALPVPVQEEALGETTFAAGGQQKSSFAFLKNSKIYVSQHIGNLETVDTCQDYDRAVEMWKTLLSIDPQIGVGDRHPDYYSSHYIQKRHSQSVEIQHHHAHVWSGMLDNRLSPPFLGIAWDGTGWGEDRTIWGGEAFVVTEYGIQRCASLYPFRLPGGEKAIREPRRSALGLIDALFSGAIPPMYSEWLSKAFSKEELTVLSQALVKKINAPLCSSMGRLFDGVSALIGACMISQYEGQAALALEALAYRADRMRMGYSIPLLHGVDILLLDWRPMVIQIVEDHIQGVYNEEIALAFHEALAQGIVALAKVIQQENVLLTGGVMQNKLLTELAIRKLTDAGFKPHWHQHIPPNDGGLAVGQIGGLFRQIEFFYHRRGAENNAES